MSSANMRVAETSTSAVAHNLRTIKDQSGGAEVIAIVKANGYGHGAEIMARALLAGDCKMLGVVDIDEALALRHAGITPEQADILCWLHSAHTDFYSAFAADIEIAISDMEQLERVATAAKFIKKARNTGDFTAKTPALHIKLDTGMSRNGVGRDTWPAIFAKCAALEKDGVLRVRGIMTHLANAGKDADLAQCAEFDAAVDIARAAGLAPELLHVAASAAVFSDHVPRYNTVRVGLATYGLSPFAGTASADLGLRPAMRMVTEIVALRQAPAGTSVSYGYTYTTECDTVLALLPLGYADGLPRALNNYGATVSIAGLPRPIVGRIGMDQCIVDVGTELGARLQLGDKVVMFGDPTRGEPAVDTWAESMQTINYEIVACLGARPQRVAVS
ncbi:MAG: alanine racemase [Microbacteriaceae bacterium]|nr:alanine racemase [Microbacteriaceae bacterium]